MVHSRSNWWTVLDTPSAFCKRMSQYHDKLSSVLHSKSLIKINKFHQNWALSQTFESSIKPKILAVDLNWFSVVYCILTGFVVTIRPRLNSSNVTIGLW